MREENKDKDVDGLTFKPTVVTKKHYNLVRL